MTSKELIAKMGGSTAVAKLLKFETKNGAQRVNNWINRGVPLRIKVKYPDLFPMDLDNKI